MKIIFALIVLLVVVLQYELWFSKTGLLSANKLRQTIAQKQQVQQQRQLRNHALIAEIRSIKDSPEMLLSHARYDLGMIRRDEVFYQLV